MALAAKTLALQRFDRAGLRILADTARYACLTCDRTRVQRAARRSASRLAAYERACSGMLGNLRQDREDQEQDSRTRRKHAAYEHHV